MLYIEKDMDIKFLIIIWLIVVSSNSLLQYHHTHMRAFQDNTHRSPHIITRYHEVDPAKPPKPQGAASNFVPAPAPVSFSHTQSQSHTRLRRKQKGRRERRKREKTTLPWDPPDFLSRLLLICFQFKPFYTLPLSELFPSLTAASVPQKKFLP